jgi:uncharacterized membrane protein YciS (DUF1049 family)
VEIVHASFTILLLIIIIIIIIIVVVVVIVILGPENEEASNLQYCTTRNFVICTDHLVLLAWLNQGGYDGLGT